MGSRNQRLDYITKNLSQALEAAIPAVAATWESRDDADNGTNGSSCMKVSSADSFESSYPLTRLDVVTANRSLFPLVYFYFDIFFAPSITSREPKLNKMPGLPFNDTVGDTIPPDTSHVSR